jgi:hypothetical protein
MKKAANNLSLWEQFKKSSFVLQATLVIFISFFFTLLVSKNPKSNNTQKQSENGKSICYKCYKKFNQSEGWDYDIGGVPTQNVNNTEKHFCSYYCAKERGIENTPKSWRKQFN